MGVNRHKPHLCIIPEDDANRQLAVGFRDHYAVNPTAIDLRAPAGGWGHVLDVFEQEYVPYLRRYSGAHVALLLDFDEDETRRSFCDGKIPDDVRSRVLLLGAFANPEILRRELSMPLDEIGETVAANCVSETDFWNNPHLAHNLPELARMLPLLKPILFAGA